MTIRFYMDAHVNWAVTSGLRIRGVDVITAQEEGTADWSDEELLLRSSSMKRVLVTQDEDFLAIADSFQRQQRYFAGVLYGHQQDMQIGMFIEQLSLIAEAGFEDEWVNTVGWLPLY